MSFESLEVKIDFKLWLSTDEALRFFIFFNKLIIFSQEWHFINEKPSEDRQQDSRYQYVVGIFCKKLCINSIINVIARK